MTKFKPVELFPYRTALDVCDAIKGYTKNKKVCDLGCGAGDLLEYLKVNNFCDDVVGIEIDETRVCKEREYIIHADIFAHGVPDADVYVIYQGAGFPFARILEMIKPKSIVISLDNDLSIDIYEKDSRMEYLEKIYYEYDESKYVDDLESFEKMLEDMRSVNPNWTVKNTRYVRVFKYNG